MPIISSFYGIIIKMYFQQNDHNPPHIHAIYGEYIGIIDINKCQMIAGDLPNKALTLVLEWVKLHKLELLYMWNTQDFNNLPAL